MARSQKDDDRLDELEEVILSLKRGNKKLSVSKIAERVGIALLVSKFIWGLMRNNL